MEKFDFEKFWKFEIFRAPFRRPMPNRNRKKREQVPDGTKEREEKKEEFF